MVSGTRYVDLHKLIEVPQYGCFRDRQRVEVSQDPDQVLANIWSIGGERGWYNASWLWNFRGFLDQLAGGVGLRRGRTNMESIHSGDALDFWRVIYANREKRRLLLYAEMKLPGEAWLEFRLRKGDGKEILEQTATFRPRGLWGRFYWYLLIPFHMIIFGGMARRIESFKG